MGLVVSNLCSAILCSNCGFGAMSLDGNLGGRKFDVIFSSWSFA